MPGREGVSEFCACTFSRDAFWNLAQIFGICSTYVYLVEWLFIKKQVQNCKYEVFLNYILRSQFYTFVDKWGGRVKNIKNCE